MLPKRIVIPWVFFFPIDWHQSYTAQPWKTLKWAVFEVDQLASGVEPRCFMESSVFFCFISSTVYEGRATIKYYFPGHSLKLQAPGLWELLLGFVSCSFNLNSLLWLWFRASALLLSHNDPKLEIDGLNLTETTQTVPQRNVRVYSEKWITPLKRVSRKPLNDFHKAQTIEDDSRRE